MPRLSPRLLAFFALAAASAAVAQTTAPGAVSPQQLYVKADASLVVVRYIWASEIGPREVEMPGVVIDASGVVMCNAAIVNDAVPLKQIQDVKILVRRPGGEAVEVAADFQGRDDRCGLAYFKAAVQQDWTPLAFTPATPVAGDTVYSVGLLSKNIGYKAVIGRSMVSAVRSEGPQVMVDTGVAGGGAIVFDTAGHAVGYAVAVVTPGGRGQPQQPGVFVPSSAFAAELADRPTRQKPVYTAWMGVSDWNGLKRDEAAYYGITSPAIHIGGVIPGGPFDRAGLKAGDVLVGYDGRPLEGGDAVDSVPVLLRQRIMRTKPGDVAHFDIISAKNAKPHAVEVTLAPTPPLPNTADRFWAETLGLGVRDTVFLDRFARRLPADASGVVVTLVRPGGRAEAAHLAPDVFVEQVAGRPVTDVKSFANALHDQQQESPDAPVVLLINQNGRDETVRIETN